MSTRRTFAGATTDALDDGIVVFLIGMRVNRWWRPDLWVPVVRSMGWMVRELLAHRDELGFLGIVPTGFSNPVVLIQYWRSFDHLHRFSAAENGLHTKAWREFNRRVRKTNAVGVWHETYLVAPGAHESIYVNMPPFGLGAAVGERPATGDRASARNRLQRPASDLRPAN